MSDIGHNSGVAGSELKAFCERIERLAEEKDDISGDIREVYAEAKGNGFDVKVLRKVIAIRKMDQNKRQEEQAVLETYLSALGLF